MFHPQTYLPALITQLRRSFGPRLRYVGLQGSYLRGEATEDSDLDVMVVLDHLAPADLDRYRAILAALPQPEKACGFLCGTEDLARWNRLEIGHLLHTTQDWYGSLRDLVPASTRRDAWAFLQLSAGNLYHEVCHRWVHGDWEETAAALPGLYKGTFFLLQNLHWLRTGDFLPTRAALGSCLPPEDRAVLDRGTALRQEAGGGCREDLARLLAWCQGVLAEADGALADET